jgi:glycosyltransferase involved in cell wall biosynthesis
MNIIQITPGAGGMYCGGCFRDNALVAALRKQGHNTLMVPLYLPLTLDEPDQSAGIPTFFGGINVYLEQKSAFFRHAPNWLHGLLASPALLRWASKHSARTRAAEVGDIMISMLQGEEGRQARELDELIAWLKTRPRPDVICLSNALLAGLARKLKVELQCVVTCLLGGEDAFLDGLPSSARDIAWKILAERCRDVDLFLPPTRYFSELMCGRLSLHPEKVRVVPNGINLAGYSAVPSPGSLVQGSPVLGYFARMCREKGLDTLVDAYLLLRKREAGKTLRLHVGGGCGPMDEPFVEEQRRKLDAAGALSDAQFFPNIDHAAKIAFYQNLTVFSTPALYGEAFGLYVIEAMAVGVPIVQPRHAAFPELIEATGGGVLCEPGDSTSLADAIESLLRDQIRARALGAAGREAVAREFNIDTVAAKTAQAFEQVRLGRL